jgi:hypothetical protein
VRSAVVSLALVLGGVAALGALGAFPARAHVDPVGTLVADGLSSLSLTAHNDRDQSMTGFRATVPEGFTVLSAPGPDGWGSEVSGAEASWDGGELGSGDDATFTLELDGSREPGPVEIGVEQLYADGGAVPWTVAVTAVPASIDDGSGGGVRWRDLLVVAALGVLTVAAVLALRRGRSLQEK